MPTNPKQNHSEPRKKKKILTQPKLSQIHPHKTNNNRPESQSKTKLTWPLDSNSVPNWNQLSPNHGVFRVVTHHDMEGAVRNVFPSEADGDDVLPWLWSRVINIKRPICVLHYIHIQLRSVRRWHLTGDFTFPCSLCIHGDDCFLSDLDGWSNSWTWQDICGTNRVKAVISEVINVNERKHTLIPGRLNV